MAIRIGGKIDLTGERFGCWTVVERRGSNEKNRQARWLVRCDCGTEQVSDAQAVRRFTSSCVKCRAKPGTTHGMSYTYLYRAWRSMKQRCDPNNKYKKARYYDRGITVCKQWVDDFEAFSRYVNKYLGERPTDKHSLDRRNNNKGYRPGNIRWATATEQNLNTQRGAALRKQ